MDEKGPLPGPPGQTPNVELEPREGELVRWFRYARRQGRLPSRPFRLRPGVRVRDPERLYAELEAGCVQTPKNRHARRLWLDRLADLRRALAPPGRAPPADGLDADDR